MNRYKVTGAIPVGPPDLEMPTHQTSKLPNIGAGVAAKQILIIHIFFPDKTFALIWAWGRTNARRTLTERPLEAAIML